MLTTNYCEEIINSGNCLHLHELIEKSDVVLKAFAGEGSYYREQLKHFAGDEDFIITFKPDLIYKGEKLFRELELTNSQRFFLING